MARMEVRRTEGTYRLCPDTDMGFVCSDKLAR